MKEASYTVEAVFVGCITIWVILALLYSSFYIHDRMILGSEIGNRIECGSERGELSVSEKEENNLCRLLNEKLFLMKINQLSLTKKIASVRADVRYSSPSSRRRKACSSASPISATSSRWKPGRILYLQRN